MNEKCRIYLQEFFNQDKYKIESIWNFNENLDIQENKITMSDYLNKKIEEKMPDMLKGMFQSMISDSFYQFFQNMKNKLH